MLVEIFLLGLLDYINVAMQTQSEMYLLHCKQ